MDKSKLKIILKVGGSILSISNVNGCPDFNTNYTYQLSKILLKYNVDAGMVIGGGFINKYMLNIIYSRYKNYNNPKLIDRYHHIGIASLNLNANMFLTVFMQSILGSKNNQDVKLLERVIAYRDFENLESLKLDSYNYFIAGAYKPGHSSDMDALILARHSGSNIVISLKNVDGVYSKDPTQNRDAKFLDKLSWDDYLKIIKVKTFAPRGNFPVDPITAQVAKDLKMRFIIVSGDNFLKFMPDIIGITNNPNWRGTIID